MPTVRFKQWLGERATVVAVALFCVALILYGAAYLIEKGFDALSPATVIAAIATALLLASVSVTLEQYVKARLTDPEVISILAARKLGIHQVQERNVAQGLFTGLPLDVLGNCHHELVIVAYAADNFVVRNKTWITQAVDGGKHIGILILDPDVLDQAKQTEKRDLKPQIQTTLGFCEQIIVEKAERKANFKIRGYAGHFYYTGVLVDRYIISGNPSSVHVGMVCVQLKANYRSQHEGIVLTLTPSSRYAEYYSASCRELWKNARDLI